MPTEKVTLELRSTAVYVAGLAARQAELSLEDWISRAIVNQGFAEDAERAAEYFRLHPEQKQRHDREMRDYLDELEEYRGLAEEQ
jgi:hypothetical protein